MSLVVTVIVALKNNFAVPSNTHACISDYWSVRRRNLTMFSVILRCSNGSILPIDLQTWSGGNKQQEMQNRSVDAGLVYKY